MNFWKYFKQFVLTGQLLKIVVSPSQRGGLIRSLLIAALFMSALGVVGWGTKNHGIPVLIFYLFSFAVSILVGYIGGGYTGYLQNWMAVNGQVDKARLSRLKTTTYLIYVVFTLLTVIAGYLVQGKQLAILGGLLFAFFVISKGGFFLWAVALLPALKTVPAALSGYYLKKWLDDRGKKKSTPETPTPAIPPPQPTPVKRARKKATPQPPL